jgi:hypothetical protein
MRASKKTKERVYNAITDSANDWAIENDIKLDYGQMIDLRRKMERGLYSALLIDSDAQK